MKEKVSFVIVAYKAEKTLDWSLRSLKNQDYPHNNIEVILVDGLSSDRTKEIMLEFQKDEISFNRIVVKDNPGKYLACGWNVALKEVTGDIVLRVDAHTRFPKDFISKNVDLIEKGEDICGGKVHSILQDDTEWNRTLLAAENSMFGGGFSFFRRGEVAKYTNTLAFAAYRKTVFDKVGEYNEQLVRTEDNEMHYRMRKAGYKFYFDPTIESYRFNRSSLNGLLRQKFLNGYWVGLTHAVEPMAFSLFYLVPLFLVLTIIFTIIICPFTKIPLLIIAILYTMVLLFSLAGALRSRGWHYTILALSGIIAGLHFLYGIGTIKGLCEEDFAMKSNILTKLHNTKTWFPIYKFIYWLIEIFLLPFKSIIWAFKYII